MTTSAPVRKVHDIPIVITRPKPRQLPEVAPERYVPIVEPWAVPVREPVRRAR